MFNQLENFGYSRCTYNRYSCVQLSESYPAYACTVKKKKCSCRGNRRLENHEDRVEKL